MYSSVALGYHCAWSGSARPRAIVFPQTPTQVNDQPIPNWLESVPLDDGDEINPRPRPTWWTVELDGFTIANLESKPDTFRLPFDGLEKAWESGAPDATRWTPLQARVIYSNNSGRQRAIDVDIGHGCRFSVLSDQVKVWILSPRGSRAIVEGGEPITGTGGVRPPEGGGVSASMVVGTLAETPSAIGARGATFTRTIDVPGGAEAFYPLPPYARTVTPYQIGGVRQPLQWALVGLPGTPTIGTLGVAGANAAGPVHIIPQAAQAIRVPPGPAGRRLTFVATLDL